MTNLPTALETTGDFDFAEPMQRLRSQLVLHPIYDSVQTIDRLRLFMREHVFAVWDFMSLLKRLQSNLTCCGVPWLPSPDATSARFINDIVLAEETDEDGLGGYSSHFELYLAAMEEVGADSRPIRQFISQLNQRTPFSEAIAAAPILESTREFVRSTIRVAVQGQVHEVAAAFFYGREDVIPDMFARLVDSLPQQGVPVGRMVHYLRRHIELDANDHGPLALKLVNSLCGNTLQRKQEATTSAIDAITSRISLWDGILAEIGRITH